MSSRRARAPAPTLAQEPGAGARRDRALGRFGGTFPPPVEPGGGGARIVARARAPAAVLARVAQHVAQRVPHLAWRTQDAVLVAVDEDTAPAPPEPVQSAGHADREPLQAARQGGPAGAFDDQVQMIRLHAVVHQAKAAALAARNNRGSQRRVLLQAAQRREPRLHAHRHFHWKPGSERRASAVRHVRALAVRLGSRTLAPSAPTVGKLKPRLPQSRAPFPAPTRRCSLLGHRSPPSRRRPHFAAVALDRAEFPRNCAGRRAAKKICPPASAHTRSA